MACSSDEEEDVLTKHVQFLSELSRKLTSKALMTENPTEPIVEATIEAGMLGWLLMKIVILQFQILGFRCKSTMKKILDQLSEANGKELDLPQIDEVLEDFVYQFQVFSHHVGKFKEYRSELIDFQLTMTELGKELMKRNSKFDQVRSQTAKRNIDESSKDDDSHGVVEEECETPKAVRKKFRFAKLTPKADLAPAFSCHLCGKKYGWLKSLARHLKDHHDGAAVEPNLTEIRDYITCRMCKSRQRRENVTRHLFEAHKIEKKGSKAIFRGFITFDNINWQPLFLEKGAEDPPTESSVMVPIKDGKVTLYGVVFEVEQAESDELGVDTNAESNDKEMAEDIKLQETEPAKITVNQQNNRSGRTSSPMSAEGTSSLVDDFTLEELESFGTPLPRQEVRRDRSSDLGEKPAAARRLNLEELTDEFYEEDSNMTGETDTEKNVEKSVGGEAAFKHQEMPKLKVQVFSVEVSEGELWSADPDEWLIDSDFEDGDSKDDAAFRSEMKQIRLV